MQGMRRCFRKSLYPYQSVCPYAEEVKFIAIIDRSEVLVMSFAGMERSTSKDEVQGSTGDFAIIKQTMRKQEGPIELV